MDVEALLVQITILAIFGVVYAWIGGKIGFRSGVKSAKKEIFELFEINPKEWKRLSPKEKRAKLTQLVGGLIQDVLKQAAPNPDTEEAQEDEMEVSLLPDPTKYERSD